MTLIFFLLNLIFCYFKEKKNTYTKNFSLLIFPNVLVDLLEVKSKKINIYLEIKECFCT